jgi:uncharacterized membrane protein
MGGQTLGIIRAAAQLGFSSLANKPRRGIGPLTAQVTVEESANDELEITDQPVEQGARISDHAFKRPAEVVIKCGWSNSPTIPGFIDGLVGAVTGTIAGVESLLTGNDVNQVNDIYQQLLELQASRVPMTVYTGKRTYENMLIKSLRQETSKETENTLMITATLRQVIIVTTQTVVVPAPAAAQRDPGTTSPTLNQGSKSLGPAPNYNAAAGASALGPAPRGDL